MDNGIQTPPTAQAAPDAQPPQQAPVAAPQAPSAPLTVDAFAAKIKAKYPQYQSLSNAELTSKILAKYPVYRSQVQTTPSPQIGQPPAVTKAQPPPVQGGPRNTRFPSFAEAQRQEQVSAPAVASVAATASAAKKATGNAVGDVIWQAAHGHEIGAPLPMPSTDAEKQQYIAQNSATPEQKQKAEKYVEHLDATRAVGNALVDTGVGALGAMVSFELGGEVAATALPADLLPLIHAGVNFGFTAGMINSGINAAPKAFQLGKQYGFDSPQFAQYATESGANAVFAILGLNALKDATPEALASLRSDPKKAPIVEAVDAVSQEENGKPLAEASPEERTDAIKATLQDAHKGTAEKADAVISAGPAETQPDQPNPNRRAQETYTFLKSLGDEDRKTIEDWVGADAANGWGRDARNKFVAAVQSFNSKSAGRKAVEPGYGYDVGAFRSNVRRIVSAYQAALRGESVDKASTSEDAHAAVLQAQKAEELERQAQKAPPTEKPKIEARAKQVRDKQAQIEPKAPEPKASAVPPPGVPLADLKSRPTSPDRTQGVRREPIKPLSLGAAIEVLSSDGTKLPAHYAAVRLNDLRPSHNPWTWEWYADYPEAAQPRERTFDKKAKKTVEEVGSKPDPKQLFSTDPTAQVSPPVILPDGVVLAGNGRAMGMALAYDRGNGGAIAGAFPEQQGRYGDVQFSDADQPVPVILLDSDITDQQQLKRLGGALNVGAAGGLDAAEEGNMAASFISPAKMDEIAEQMERMQAAVEPDKEGKIEQTTLRKYMAKYSEQLGRFMVDSGMVPAQRAKVYVYQDGPDAGKLTEKGKDLFEAALRGRAFGDPALVMEAESVASNIIDKLDRSLGIVNKIKGRGGDWDFTQFLPEALRQWVRARNNYETVSKTGDKGDSLVDRWMFPDNYREGNKPLPGMESDIPKVAAILARALENSGPELKVALGAYADEMDKAGDPNQTAMFGGTGGPDPVTTFNATVAPLSDLKGQPDLRVTADDWNAPRGSISSVNSANGRVDEGVGVLRNGEVPARSQDAGGVPPLQGAASAGVAEGAPAEPGAAPEGKLSGVQPRTGKAGPPEAGGVPGVRGRKRATPPPGLEQPEGGGVGVQGVPAEAKVGPPTDVRVRRADSAAAQAVRDRIRKRATGQLNVGFDPGMLSDMVELGYYHFRDGVDDFTAWSKKMLADVGEAARPYLNAAWHGIQDAVVAGLEFPGDKESADDRNGKAQGAVRGKGRRGVAGPPPQADAGNEPGGAARGGPADVSGGRTAGGRRAPRVKEQENLTHGGHAAARVIELAPAPPRAPAVVSDAEWQQRLKAAGLPGDMPAPTVRLPDDIAAKLTFPGQRELGDYVVSSLDANGGALLASGVGSGKTYVAAATVADLVRKNPNARVLVLTKNRGLIEQEDRGMTDVFGQFGVQLSDLELAAVPSKPGVAGTTYAMLVRHPELADGKFDLVVADESAAARRWWDSDTGALVKKLTSGAGKALYMSATPYHTPLELGYMEKLGLWPKGGFEQWVSQFGVRRKDGKWSGTVSPTMMAGFRAQMIQRGVFANLDLDLTGFNANFGVVPLSGEQHTQLEGIQQAFQMTEDWYRGRGQALVANRIRGLAVNFQKAWLERTRLPQVIEHVENLRENGWQAVIFTETKAGREELYKPLQEADYALNGAIKKLMQPLPSLVDALREKFGDELADLTGPYDARRKNELAAYLSGKKKVAVGTYASIGEGVSLHDTEGTRPRAAVYSGVPYSGIQLHQGTGRLWRYGTKSDVHATFLFSDALPEKAVMDKVTARLASLNASITGAERGKVLDGLRGNDAARAEVGAYSLGGETRLDPKEFRQIADTSNYKNWKGVTVGLAENAKNRGVEFARKQESVQGPLFKRKGPPPGGEDEIQSAIRKLHPEVDRDTFEELAGLFTPDEINEDDFTGRVDSFLDSILQERDNEKRQRELDEEQGRKWDEQEKFKNYAQREVELSASELGIKVERKGRDSRYLTLEKPLTEQQQAADDEPETITVRIADHEPKDNRGGYQGGEFGDEYHDQAELSVHPGGMSVADAKQIIGRWVRGEITPEQMIAAAKVDIGRGGKGKDAEWDGDAYQRAANRLLGRPDDGPSFKRTAPPREPFPVSLFPDMPKNAMEALRAYDRFDDWAWDLLKRYPAKSRELMPYLRDIWDDLHARAGSPEIGPDGKPRTPEQVKALERARSDKAQANLFGAEPPPESGRKPSQGTLFSRWWGGPAKDAGIPEVLGKETDKGDQWRSFRTANATPVYVVDGGIGDAMLHDGIFGFTVRDEDQVDSKALEVMRGSAAGVALMERVRGDAKDGPVVVIASNDAESRDVANLLAHELHHAWQYRLERDAGDLLDRRQLLELADHAVVKKTAEQRKAAGYIERPEIAVMETAARLAAESPEALGVTPVEAGSFLDEYFTKLAERHGGDAERTLEGVLRKRFYEAYGRGVEARRAAGAAGARGGVAAWAERPPEPVSGVEEGRQSGAGEPSGEAQDGSAPVAFKRGSSDDERAAEQEAWGHAKIAKALGKVSADVRSRVDALLDKRGPGNSQGRFGRVGPPPEGGGMDAGLQGRNDQPEREAGRGNQAESSTESKPGGSTSKREPPPGYSSSRVAASPRSPKTGRAQPPPEEEGKAPGVDWSSRIATATGILARPFENIEREAPELAVNLRRVRAAPEAAAAVANGFAKRLFGDMTPEQKWGFRQMADAASRSYLENFEPDEFKKYSEDSRIQQAVEDYASMRDEMSQMRRWLGGKTIEGDYFPRTYPEGVRPPTQIGGYFDTGKVGPRRADSYQRLATAQYFYEHGERDPEPEFKRKWMATYLAYTEQQAFASFARDAHVVLNEDQPPAKVTWRGRTLYRRGIIQDVAKAEPGSDLEAKLKKQLGVQVLPDPKKMEQYHEYRFAPANRQLRAAGEELEQALRAGGVEDTSGTIAALAKKMGNDAARTMQVYLAPERIVDAMNSAADKDKIGKWMNQNAAGHALNGLSRFARLNFIVVSQGITHAMNLGRSIAMQERPEVLGIPKSGSMGELDPRGWINAFRVLSPWSKLSEGLKERANVTNTIYRAMLESAAISLPRVIDYTQDNFNPNTWLGHLAHGSSKWLYGEGGVHQRTAQFIAEQEYKRLSDYVGDNVRSEFPHATDDQVAKAVQTSVGMINRASWNMIQRGAGHFMLFPSWLWGRARFMLDHPLKSSLPPAVIALAVNNALYYMGVISAKHRWDPAAIEFAGHRVIPSLLFEPLTRHLMQAPFTALLKEFHAKPPDVPSWWEESGGEAVEQFIPILQEIGWLQPGNRSGPLNARPITEPSDARRRGPIGLSKATWERLTHAVSSVSPLVTDWYDVMSEKPKDEVMSLLGSMFGVTNYPDNVKKRSSRGRGFPVVAPPRPPTYAPPPM